MHDRYHLREYAFQVNETKIEAGVSILIFDKIDMKSKLINRDIEELYIVIKVKNPIRG